MARQERDRRRARGGLLAAPLSFLAGAAGIAAGAVAMYLLDPVAGAARRVQLRDRAAATARRGMRAGRSAAEQAADRARGSAAEVANRTQEGTPPDDVLVDQVRAELGHDVRHGAAIDVAVTDGTVTLSGPILASEAGGLIPRIATLPGVRGVDDRLEVHESDDGIPSLQG